MIRGRRFRAWFALLFLLAAVLLVAMGIFGSGAPEPTGVRLDRVAFTGVRVVEPELVQASEPQTILVSAGKIESIYPVEALSVPPGYTEVALPGRFVVPGYWNMHAHLGRLQVHYAAPMMLMHGIFYARNMSGDCVGWMCWFIPDADENRALTHAATRGDLMVPAFIGGIGSHVIRGSRVAPSWDYPAEPKYLAPSTYEEGRALARHAASRGVDFLKPYNSLHPEALRGLIDEADALGLYVGGHVPRGLTLDDAIELGLRTVEHGRMLPLACSTLDEEFASDYRAWLDAPAGTVDKPSLSQMLGELLQSPDDAACSAVLAAWSEKGAYYVPTHVTRLADTVAADRPFIDDPRARTVPSLVLRWGWEAQASEYETMIRDDPDLAGELRALYERGVALTGQAHEAGVGVMVGSDTGDVLIYPGESFHEEMRIFADAGMSPAAILAAATSVPAEFAGLSATHGSVAVGKRADLVFLSANPLVTIENADAINALYVGGRFYDEDARNEVIEEVARKSRGLPHHLAVGWFVVTRLIPGAAMRGMTRLRNRIDEALN
ncbi:MAG: amidohydrolase family protein [Myxococcota bacterium]